MNARRHPAISGHTPRIPRFRPLSGAAAAGAALGMVVLSGCGGTAGGDDNGGRLEVVASFYPAQFLAQEVGGRHVDVRALTKPGVEPHDLELSPRQTAELSEAGLVVYLKGFQPAVDEAVEQSGAEHVAEIGSHAAPEEHAAPEGHGGAGDGQDHAEDHAEDDGGHGHEGHGHGDGGGAADPHIWLDPVKYAEAAEGVGEAMAEADPDHAADYRRNAEELSSKLKDLDGEFREGLRNRRTDTFITNHAAFGHLAARYGLHEEAISGLDPESGTSGARLKELHRIAEEDDVNTVFFETLVSDRAARTLARDMDLRTDVLDPVEGITGDSRGDDYFQVMRSNLEALRKALGAR